MFNLRIEIKGIIPIDTRCKCSIYVLYPGGWYEIGKGMHIQDPVKQLLPFSA